MARRKKRRKRRVHEVRRQPKSHRRRRTRRARRIRWKSIITMLGVIALLAGLCYLTIVLFETKKIQVTGNQYSSAQEVQEWVQSDQYSSNTLYIMWKYNKDDIEQLPAVEKIRVKLKSPWEVTVQVTEKKFSGRVDFNGEYLYFDKNGIASLKSAEVIEGVPYIEGMELDTEKVELGKVLPVTDESVFEKISSVSVLLNEAALTPDKISCSGSDLTLHFGTVRIQMGSSDYADKLTQASAIMAKLNELYPGQAGVLHLENYTNSDSSVRFVPDPAVPES